jgi:prohibitin 1
MVMMDTKRLIGAVVIGGAVLLGGGLFAASLTQIEQGHVGVVYNRNGGVEPQTLGQGMHFVSPMKRVTEYPVALETVEFKDVQLATKDGKPLTISMSFNYMNDPAKVVDIFNKFKGAEPDTIVDTFIRSRVKEAALSVTSNYTILEIFQNREKIKVDIAKRLTEDLKKHGFIVADFVLGTPVPDESTAKAIQAVVDAQQQLEALKIETEKAKQEALRKQEVAEGEAKAKIIQAEAEAKANRIVSQSLTPELLKKMEMEARMKHGWVEIQGANAVVTQNK